MITDKILIYGSTYLTQVVVNHLVKEGFNLVGYVPSKNPTFPGKVMLPIVGPDEPHTMKLSIQYDQKITDLENAFNVHTGLLPEYGGCNILYHTIKNQDDRQGATFHGMTENFDKGPIVSEIFYTVSPKDTVLDLYKKLEIILPCFVAASLYLLPIINLADCPVLPPTLYSKKDGEETGKQLIADYVRQKN